MSGERPMTPAELIRGLKNLDPGLHAAILDLDYLHQAGALEGVAEILAERRRQIEVKGHTASSDSELRHDEIVVAAKRMLTQVMRGRMSGGDGQNTDADCLRRAGALVAAEISRIGRVETPDHVRAVDGYAARHRDLLRERRLRDSGAGLDTDPVVLNREMISDDLIRDLGGDPE